MIVVDASVVVDLLLDLSPAAEAVRARLAGEVSAWAAPELMDAEVAHVLRSHVLRAELSAADGTSALGDLIALPIERQPHLPLLPRAFELRDNATIHDALYLALAEALGARLLTRDARLAHVPGVDATVEVVGSPTCKAEPAQPTAIVRGPA